MPKGQDFVGLLATWKRCLKVLPGRMGRGWVVDWRLCNGRIQKGGLCRGICAQRGSGGLFPSQLSFEKKNETRQCGEGREFLPILPGSEATLRCTCYPGMPRTDLKSYRRDFICGIIPQLLLENLCMCVFFFFPLAMFCSLYNSPSSTVLTWNLFFLDTRLLILGLGGWWGWVGGFSQALSHVSQQSGWSTVAERMDMAPTPISYHLRNSRQSCQTSHRGRTQITTTSSSLLVLTLTVSLFVGMNVNSEVGTDLDLSPWSSSLQPGDLGWVSCPMYGGDSPSLWELEEKMKPQRSVYKKPLCTRYAQHMLAAFLPFFCVW